MKSTSHSDMSNERDIPHNETATLIASDKVEGTPVYGIDGKKIGRIENLMIDKFTGQVAYAVLSFGGFLGLGTDHYPLPWSMLKYDENVGGYVVNITKDQLKNAPKFHEDDDFDWNREQGQQIDAYYMVMM